MLWTVFLMHVYLIYTRNLTMILLYQCFLLPHLGNKPQHLFSQDRMRLWRLHFKAFNYSEISCWKSCGGSSYTSKQVGGVGGWGGRVQNLIAGYYFFLADLPAPSQQSPLLLEMEVSHSLVYEMKTTQSLPHLGQVAELKSSQYL